MECFKKGLKGVFGRAHDQRVKNRLFSCNAIKFPIVCGGSNHCFRAFVRDYAPDVPPGSALASTIRFLCLFCPSPPSSDFSDGAAVDVCCWEATTEAAKQPDRQHSFQSASPCTDSYTVHSFLFFAHPAPTLLFRPLFSPFSALASPFSALASLLSADCSLFCYLLSEGINKIFLMLFVFHATPITVKLK